MERKAGDWLQVSGLTKEVPQLGGMIIKSAKLQRVANTIQRLAPYKSTVLIQGESGTGKDLVARALHQCGPKTSGPFIIFNCSNLVDSLAESQLFGHVKGAFTDARDDAIGYFRAADGGTLFLDEIGELPPALQPKLLRAVETHEVQPVGSSRAYQVDIRLIVATNRDLSAMMAAGSFRADLYYRLNAAAILVPPLRERLEAIETLVAYFARLCGNEIGKEIRYVSRAAMEILAGYEWPGNLRELRHAIESAVMLAEGDHIDVDQLPDSLKAAPFTTRSNGSLGVQAPSEHATAEPCYNDNDFAIVPNPVRSTNSYSLDEAIKLALVRALRKANGNCHLAAKLLGISRYTVYRMMTRFGLGQVRNYREVGINEPLETRSLLSVTES
jgi:transcriptional regulator with GAF, ATPase, and Fis domain